MLEAILKSKSYELSDHKRAAKYTIKLLFKNGCDCYTMKIMVNNKMTLNHSKSLTTYKNSIKGNTKYVLKLTLNKAASYKRVR